jgi:hypothetical protein
MKKLLAITVLLILPAACRMEMQMDYIPVEPIYVIEGYISEQGIGVAVSTTKDMEDNNGISAVENAVVEISGTDGLRETLALQPGEDGEPGVFISEHGSAGTPGNSYTLTVRVDGKEFTSMSEMKARGELTPAVFRYEPDFTDRFMFCSVGITDPADTDNHYCLRVLKNGENFSRTLVTDKGHDGGTIPCQLALRFSWSEEPTAEEIAAGNEDRMFRKGDELAMVLETIDRAVYDYLYSMDLSVGSLSNPLTNIAGGALGYFRAFSSCARTTVFDPETLQTTPEIKTNL